MWTILLLCDDDRHSDDVAHVLMQIDTRVSVHQVADITEALKAIESRRFMLIVVAQPQNPQKTLENITEMRKRLAKTPLLVEVSSKHSIVSLQALRKGASDFVKTPVAPWEWARRARCFIDAQRQQNALTAAMRRGARYLLRKDEALTPYLLRVLGRADIYHDRVTGHHERNTAQLTQFIAKGLDLPRSRCHLISSGACLHDIGKIAIPDKVLKKTGRFTRQDRDIMRDHARLGYEILADADTAVLRIGAEIALGHHERMDGSGYPDGLRGEEIPLSARITAVADVFESLTGRRHYREPLSVNECLDYLEREQSELLDRNCMAVLRSQQDQLTTLVNRLNIWPER